MSKEVKRYDCTDGGARFCQGCYTMSECEFGEYVSWDDYEALLEENQQLRQLTSEKVINATMLREFVARDGGLTIGLEGGACALMAQAFGQQLYESEAFNYIEASFDSPDYPDLGQITVTLKREAGKTPHQLRREAEAERDALRAERDALRNENGSMRNAMKNARYRIEQGRVWNGMGWTLTGLHAYQQQVALDEIDAALQGAKP